MVVARDILIKIRKIVRSVNLESKKIQKEYGVSIPQVLCLDYLYQSPNYQATQKEIREYLNLNSSTTSGIIDRLETKGMLARLPKRDDRRTTYISLTSRGAQLINKIPPLFHDRLTRKLENLPEKKLTEILNSINSLTELLEITETDATEDTVI